MRDIPTDNPGRARKQSWIALFVAAALLIPAGAANRGSSFDDAYITYRYAGNLARGDGFVYNIGEKHLGTTSPLFTLLLSAGGRISPDIPFWGSLFSILSLGATAFFGFLIFRRAAGFWMGLLIIPLILYNPVLLACLGNETNLLLALLLGQYYCYQSNRKMTFAVLAALGVLTRGEGIILPAVLFWFEFHRQRREKKLDLRPLVLFVVLLSPWFIFSKFYFGSFLPSTLRVKMIMARLPGAGWTPFFQDAIKNLPRRFGVHLTEHLIVMAFFFFGLFSAFVRKKFIPLIYFFLLYFLGYSLLGVASFSWYHAPLALAVSWLAAYAIYTISVPRGEGHFHFNSFHPRLYLSCLFIHPPPDFETGKAPINRESMVKMFLLTAVLLYIFTARGIEFNDIRIKPDREAGLWLQENTPPRAAIGIPEVGIIGYYCGRKMLDLDGLIFPAMARPGRMHNYQYLIHTYRPDFIISQERAPYTPLQPGLIHPGIRNAPYRYIMAKEIRDPNLHVAIWERKP